ncbi:hypothetical protein H2203_003241 [Taxawa tesnikishii (nom. ined.)]|nr:hypothetical protein H2203_003241 [Dothideales sp. JES 119]
MRSSTVAASLLSICGAALGAPAPQPAAAPAPTAAPVLEERQLLSGILSAVASGVNQALTANNFGSILTALESAKPTASPTNVQDAVSKLSSIHNQAQPTNIYDYSAQLVANGLISSTVSSLVESIGGVLTGENNMNNKNPNPPTTIYPKKNSSDAPYDQSESVLRGAIYIPSTFNSRNSSGQQPIILMPGTGDTGYTTFIGNFIPLLQNGNQFNPVWLNIPGFLLNDAQTNSEFIAYAINYINSITHKKVAVIAWSQGNINTQWAFKYWPSTRNVTTDHIAISPDYKGTVNANFVCPDGTPQQYLATSNYITTLRKNNGDSAYVPTTTVYSGFFDEIVEPQQGTNASAFLNDARKVGVTNNEAQIICAGLPGGSFYTHEGMLYNPLSYALAIDALTHDGPGQVSRVGTAECANYIAQGLDLGDLLVTENSIPIAAAALVLYTPKTRTEPAIKSYALSPNAAQSS